MDQVAKRLAKKATKRHSNREEPDQRVPHAQRSLRTPIGVLRVTADEKGVTSIERASRATSRRGSLAAQRHAERGVRELREYFAGERTKFTVPLHLEGTSFQARAWAAMLKIPYGRTVSYAEQAKSMHSPRAVRAVGSANGANPIPIIVPCHRVVASNGGLGGYAFGLAMKRWLLAHELRA